MATSFAPADRFVVIVRNPRARRAVDPVRLSDAAAPLRADGWRIEIVDTTARAHAAELAGAAAAAGARVVVACGGDGTIGEVAHALTGTSTALAAIPAGTANVWAREARIPRDPGRALALLRDGRRGRIDVGEATLGGSAPRRFILVCSVGVDAGVVESVETHPRLKRALGRSSFIAVGALKVARLSPTASALTIDGDVARGALLMAVVSNTRLYGGMVPLARAARAEDGLLDVIAFSDWHPHRRLRLARYASIALRALTRRFAAPDVTGTPARWGTAARDMGGGIVYRHAARVEIRPTAPLPVEVDGEPLGRCDDGTPLVVTLRPLALEVIVGPGSLPVLGDG